MYKPRYFTDAEMTRCKPSCHLLELDEELLQKLDEAREICGFPFIVNSAYRSVQYERSKGRRGTSSHTKGLAVDLKCASSHVRMAMLSALIQVGFRRIGVYPTFIHADIDDAKISALWLDQSDVTRG